jgi:hypothetical protein
MAGVGEESHRGAHQVVLCGHNKDEKQVLENQCGKMLRINRFMFGLLLNQAPAGSVNAETLCRYTDTYNIISLVEK